MSEQQNNQDPETESESASPAGGEGAAKGYDFSGPHFLLRGTALTTLA